MSRGGPPVWPLERVAGVDEAGRGALAGPVAAAAVMLDPARMPAGLADSKRLSPERRSEVFAAIMAEAAAVAFALVPAGTIDRLNIRGATLLAMGRAVAALAIVPRHVVVDGVDVPPGLPCPAQALVDGDACHPAVAAASIVAKVMRDRVLLRLDGVAPAYGFAVHKGYGTLRHRLAITEAGVSAYHRRSFRPCGFGTSDG